MLSPLHTLSNLMLMMKAGIIIIISQTQKARVKMVKNLFQKTKKPESRIMDLKAPVKFTTGLHLCPGVISRGAGAVRGSEAHKVLDQH